MLDPDKMSLLDKMWALLMSDPVTFITIFGVVVASVAGFVWWLRGFISKEHIEAVDARLRLASDQEKILTANLETAKKENQELRETIALIPIGPQVLSIRDLANGTASAIDQAMVTNNELRSTLTPSAQETKQLLMSLYGGISRWGNQRAWQDRISGCFGHHDGWFAGHPLEEKRAKDVIKAAKAAGASRDDFERELEKYLNEHATAKDGTRASLLTNAKKTLRQLWGPSR